MNKYLAKLHSLQHASGAENQKTRYPEEPSKPSKLGFEGFEGDPSRRFFENSGAAKTNDRYAERIAEAAKSATLSNLQNHQNLGSQSVPQGGCRVQVVELPATGGRYRRTFAYLQLKPPAYIPEVRWQQCVEDGKRFLAKRGEQAEALNWLSADLFGLASIPDNPHPSYSRLSRYDATGLVWLLEGKTVIALTTDWGRWATAWTIWNDFTRRPLATAATQ